MSTKHRINSVPGLALSLLLHGVVLGVLMFLYLPSQNLSQLYLFAGLSDDSDVANMDEPSLSINTAKDTASGAEFAQHTESTSKTIAATEITSDPIAVLETSTQPSFLSNFALSSTFSSSTGKNTLPIGGLDGRASRVGLSRGGTEESEKSVEAALRWIWSVQQPNGSWSYQSRGAYKDSGKNTSRNSATALALLPFLGAGITHKSGKREYMASVRSGLDFLLKNMKHTPAGGSFIDDRQFGMYHQGICTIAICEAAAMTGDRNLAIAAQKAIDFIVNAQDPVSGGWRYLPQQPGDTSAVGWQWMALKSGEMSNLIIPEITSKRAVSFLDNIVGYDGGAGYGYADNTRRGAASKSTTAIGLLCRMYSGWQPEHPPMKRGVDWLAELGPDFGNIYYSYYATQVMSHYGGEKWEHWNRIMRDGLVSRQAKNGNEAGSWYASDLPKIAREEQELESGYHEYGGRLYYTSLATMILEVYYRHLPLFQKTAANEKIPLD